MQACVRACDCVFVFVCVHVRACMHAYPALTLLPPPDTSLLQALLNIISNPVNSTVPIAVEVLKSMGVYDERRVFGVTTLDVVSL